MQRSRLKNIINKSKEINKPIIGESPFDKFKKSLPIEVDDNYRLEAAWKAYGSPKDYKEALWEGLIQPIDENTYKLPSIGYNEETDEYEYLNKGEDNETVAKDIRVWDNDVIPLVKELKLGGYVRTFNEEKDCWTYTKNSQKENTLDLNKVNILEELSNNIIELFLNGGKSEYKKVKSNKAYYDKNSDTVYYTNDEDLIHEGFHARPDSVLLEQLKPYYENLNDEKILNFGGNLLFVKRFEGDPGHFYSPEELGARVSAAKFRTKGNNYTPEFFKYLRTNENLYGDNMRDLLYMYNDENLSKIFNLGNAQSFKHGGKSSYKESPILLVELIKNSKANFAKRLLDPNRKILDLGNGEIGTHKLSYATNDKGVVVYPEIQEINGELVDLSADRNAAYESAMQSGDYVIFPSEESAEWFTADNYKRYFPGLEKYAPLSRKFKQGGQMNVIPEGALHARKNNMELAKEGEVTHKGVPVVDNDGVQQAEVEKEEWTMTKELTDDVESWYKKYYDEETSQKEKDELAIKCGKRITKELLHNTDDRANLIAKMLEEEE